jgi:predicted MPP superfamily phosphohydrolase
MSKALLIHLSDIHIQSADEKIFGRLDQLSRAVQNLGGDVKTCFLVFSGDITYSGQADEYKLAKVLYKELKERLKKIFATLETIIVPGNHDCFLEKEESVRTIILSQILAGKEISIDSGVISGCTSTLKNFYHFSNEIREKDYPHELCFKEEFFVNGKNIIFNCYNTAWMSRKKESQGSIIFPNESLTPKSIVDALHVSVFHHPYNWLRANNAKIFRNHIEATSHLILTGHEHESECYAKTKHDGKNTHYFEGGVLNDTNDSEISSFNVILLDLEKRQQRFYHFEWDSEIYSKFEESNWTPISINSAIEGEIFRPNENFHEVLLDVGANFKHPRKTLALTLPDIFIWPDLRDNKIPDDEKPFSILKGDNIPSYISEHKRILLIGRDKIGKTSLLRVLYLSLTKGHVALLLKGELLKEPNEDKIKATIKGEFAKQYSGQLTEKYERLKPSEKILLLDDFHKMPINLRGKNEILSILGRLYEFIVVTTDEDLNLEEVVEASSEGSYLAQFKTFEIMELGYVLREKLIAKWYALGNEYTLNHEELQDEVRQAHSLISTVLGKNLIPSFPVFTLILLQQVEAGKNTPTANGSYGYMYEYLITEALALSKFREAEIGTKYSYLSFLAFEMFQNSSNRMDESGFRKAHESYLKNNALHFSFDGIVEDLIKANIFSKKSNDYQFKYRYLYYYFIARYFARNTSNPALVESIRSMCTKLYNENNANIIIFYSYLTQDRAVLEAILAHAKQLYNDFEPCDLESPVSTLKIYQEKIEELEFNLSEAEQTKSAIFAHKDNEKDTECEESEVEGILNINDAFKTIQIIGQILRNFPGDLGSELKKEMAKECYSLGMRMLSYIMTLFFDEKKVYLQHVVNIVIAEYKSLEESKKRRKESANISIPVSERIKKRRENNSNTSTTFASQNELADRAKEYIAQEMHKASFVIIKRISDAVGSQYLSLTYEAVLKEANTVSFSLIDASIKLDHEKPFPVNHIINLGEKLRKKNRFGYGILRDLTYLNLYLFSRNHRIRQQLCQGFQISLTNKKLITGPQKKTR